MSVLHDAVGTYHVVYPAANLDTTISGHTPNQIKQDLSGYYTELSGANIVLDGDRLTFAIPSGQKNI